jgi:DNA-directed RNA polymerase specialized sigma24 family protein
MRESLHTHAETMNQEESLAADYRLAQRCADGEVAAWEELYQQYHDRLLASIRAMLNGQHADASLVDEIAARVWYALVENDGKLLLKYNPKRGASLMTYIRMLAKDLLRRHYRSERRRQDREREVMSSRASSHSQELDHSASTLDEFLGTLSASERTFYEECLVSSGVANSAGLDYSAANIWQRTHRLYKRMLGFLNRDG